MRKLHSQPGLCLLALIAATFLIANMARAESSLDGAYTSFQKGDYAQAIEEAKKISGDSDGAVSFFIANAYAKMQELDKALPYYRKAVAAKNPSPSLHYDFGQALFASRQMKEAEASFKRSIVANFKVGASAYYVAFINQLMENADAARDFYSRVQKMRQDPDKVKQPALYQLAEMERERVSADAKSDQARARVVYEKALPLYKRARDFESGTATAEQAGAKVKEIEDAYSAIAARMRNGNPMPVKSYTLRLSQDFGYDSNVVTQADQALIEVSNKDSFLTKTSLLAKYQMDFRRTFSVIPELNAVTTLYTRRSTPRVYQNDNISLSPALRTKYEHFSGRKAATALFDIEFNLMLRDYLQAHKFPFYSRYFNLVVGERVNWFATGSTTLKASMKLYESYDPARNFYSPQISLQQNVKIFGTWDLSNTFTADYAHARDDINDEKNYKFRQSATLTKLFERVDVTPGYSVTLKDTMKQKGARGNELLINPSVELARTFLEWIDGSFEYSFSKNLSKAKTQYQYTKHEFRLGVAHSF